VKVHKKGFRGDLRVERSSVKKGESEYGASSRIWNVGWEIGVLKGTGRGLQKEKEIGKKKKEKQR